MKKSSLYCLVGGACLLASTTFTLIANGVEHANLDNSNTNETLIATTSTLNTTPKSFSSNETVYVITDPAGHQTKSFVGNTLNQSSEPIPVDMNITYYLDGNEIKAKDLTGKSGHVKVTYDFAATKTYNDKKVPFLTVTGILLDSNKFKNVKVDSGKIINETADHTILAGYTLVGLNEDLGLDLLPTSFSFEADVTEFAIETTYTFATSEIFADLDTSKLSSIDDLIGQLNQLSNGFDQILDGGNQLANGLDSALAGSQALQAGLSTLSNGANDLATGTNALANGASELAAGASSLAGGAHQLKDGAKQLTNGLGQVVDIDNQIVGKIDEITDKTVTRYNNLITRIDNVINSIPAFLRNLAKPLIEQLTTMREELETEVTTLYNNAYGKVEEYTNGIEALYSGAEKLTAGLTELSTGADSLADGANQVADGANQVADGANQLADGATQLATGSNTLVNGLDQLATGGHTLYNGLITFKEQGINKLTNFANNDLANLTNNIRSTVTAAKSYHYYSDPSAKSVKFIFKTPSIK